MAEGGFFPLFYASLGTLCHLFGGPSLSAPLALGAVMAFSVCRTANATFDRRPLYQGLLVKMGSALAFMPQRLFAVLVMPAAFVLRLAWKQSLQTMAQGSLILPQFSRGWVMGALSGACGVEAGRRRILWRQLAGRTPLWAPTTARPTPLICARSSFWTC